jgi:hypothetical protein
MCLLEDPRCIGESVVNTRSFAVFAKNDPDKGRFNGLTQQLLAGPEITHHIVSVNIGGLADFLDGDPLGRILEEQVCGRAEHFEGRFSLAETGLFLDDRPTRWHLAGLFGC